MLGAAGQQHLFGVNGEPSTEQMPRKRRALMQAPGMGLIAQQRFKVAGQRELAQRRTQQICLTRQRGVVEIEIEHPRRHRHLSTALPWRQRDLAHESATPGFAADQAHGLKLGVHATGGNQGQAMVGGQLAVRRQRMPGGISPRRMAAAKDDLNATPRLRARHHGTYLPYQHPGHPHPSWINGFIGVVIFSGSLPATRLAVMEFDPAFLTMIRAAIAAALGVLLLWLFKEKRPARNQWGPLVVVALGVVIGFPLLTALALQYVTSAHSIVFIGLLPLATAVFAVLRGGERPRPAFWMFSILGSVCVIGYAFAQGLSAAPAGDLLMLLAVLACGMGYAEGAKLSRTLGGWQVISWALHAARLPVLVSRAGPGRYRRRRPAAAAAALLRPGPGRAAAARIGQPQHGAGDRGRGDLRGRRKEIRPLTLRCDHLELDVDVVGHHAVTGPLALADLEIAAFEDELTVEHTDATVLLEHHVHLHGVCDALDGQVAADRVAVVPQGHDASGLIHAHRIKSRYQPGSTLQFVVRIRAAGVDAGELDLEHRLPDLRLLRVEVKVPSNSLKVPYIRCPNCV
ncbi:eamA-like transporter family domain-containing protein [Ditylenchus destructor]|nr:eamA-like transporter family domain-containing protein [Ditylenchus destructor]